MRNSFNALCGLVNELGHSATSVEVFVLAGPATFAYLECMETALKELSKEELIASFPFRKAERRGDRIPESHH